MSRKLTLKKLKASDLSFFQSYLKKNPKSKQKGFNLDKNIFEDKFFPSLPDVIESLPDKRALVTLTFFGPGLAPAHSLARKILKQEKNWRLNGEIVYGPEDQSNRYDVLQPDDFAFIEFVGSGSPTGVKIVLVSANAPEDATTHATVSAMFSNSSMRLLTEDDLEKIVTLGNPVENHPLRDWLDNDLMEEIAQGNGTATAKLYARRQGRGMSLTELRNAKLAAERTGLYGEMLLNRFLTDNPWTSCTGHEWTSQINAISPFDFRLIQSTGKDRHADAKSTSGPFENDIHLSIGEIIHATRSGIPYDIFRLFEVKESSAMLRVASNVGGRLLSILKAVESLPSGVTIDSLSFRPDFFDFSEEKISLQIDDSFE